MSRASEVVTVPAGFTIEYHDPTHTYKIDGEPVPSVSTVLGVLDKPALPWWGMGVGADGVIELHERGKIRVYRKQLQVLWEPTKTELEREAKRILMERKKAKATYPDGSPCEAWSKTSEERRAAWLAAAAKNMPPQWEPASKEAIVAALTREELTVNHIRDARGVAGTGAHKQFENWANLGIMPDPDQAPDDPAERGRVEALLRFCEDASESYGKSTEIIVGSKVHRFAGRYDFRCNLVGELLIGLSPRKTRTFTGEPCILDVKTSKAVYETHFLQQEGYEGASIESGYEPTKYRIIIHLLPSGNYRLHRSKRTYAEFLAVRPAHEVVKKPGTRW